ncbi:M48 family metallopeptidase [Cronobacter turicensis]|uniref:M48 family metallopeptidase n=1 Tax=Cronobacter turicensis TaxID=413502 RepID=UPI0002F92BDD|nr:M48 family metallopeptidase [Cronobacter turicensis]EKY3196073.1 M48 family metalloprotease [Cronobacter turicensis]ELY4132564.1 M48 family metalloprotease [Cronobacter turicensis]ELY4351180.1 M48 family metalloprotease [Cronobacter turicensis]ELY4481874.1 M48 family metalloprotease [Cronobacter turicensis]ELY6280167.1 M48 family metalloprotease [Cronobacter turicensis]
MHKKSVTYLFLIPLILFFYAAWQNWRVSHVLERAQYETQIVAAASESPRATLTYRHDGQETEMPAIDAQERAQQYLAENREWIGAADIEQFLARSGMFFTFISLLINAGAVALCRFCVAQGQRSQGALLRAFWLCRLLLPFIMAAQLLVGPFYQLSIAFYEIVWAAIAFNLHLVPGKVVLFLLIVAGVVLWMFWKILMTVVRCFALFRPVPKPVMGHRLSRGEAPALWQAVDALAGKAVAPDNIVVGLTDNFYVTANPLLLNNGEKVTGKTLYFPLTWAALLSPEEMTAVIGHELGHFSGKDTEFSQRFLPLYDGFSRSLDALEPKEGQKTYFSVLELRTALYSAHYFLEQFHGMVMLWRKRREHAADEAGAQASSPQALASALLRIVSLSGPVNEYLEAVYEARVETDNVVASLLAHLSGHPLPDPREHLENETSHPYDSHPPCRSRIEALGCSVELSAIQASRPVSPESYAHLQTLFADVDGLARALTAALTGQVAEHRSAWRDELQTVVEAASGEQAIFSRSRISRGGVLTIVTFVSMIVAFHADREWQFPPGKPELVGLIITLVFAYFCWLGIRSVLRYWRISQQPLMVLTPQSLIFRELTEPVPISALTGYLFLPSKSGMLIGLDYKEGYQPPPLAGARFRAYRHVDKKERQMLLDVSGKLRDADNKPVSQEGLMELVELYLHAPAAQAELHKMH